MLVREAEVKRGRKERPDLDGPFFDGPLNDPSGVEERERERERDDLVPDPLPLGLSRAARIWIFGLLEAIRAAFTSVRPTPTRERPYVWSKRPLLNQISTNMFRNSTAYCGEVSKSWRPSATPPSVGWGFGTWSPSSCSPDRSPRGPSEEGSRQGRSSRPLLTTHSS